MDKQALLTYLKQRRDSLQNLVDRDFGGQASFNYMGALRELKYLIVFIEELNRFDGDPVGEEKPFISWDQKKLGTVINYMLAGLDNRDQVKKVAKKIGNRNLDDVDSELKLVIALSRAYEQLNNL